jgi:long-chain acyl-CoA synthetase
MSSSRTGALRDLTLSTFPIEPRWGLPWRPWYERYPTGVPRGLTYPPLRAEQLLLSAAQRFPDRHAIWYYRTTWTYRELLERVKQAATNFSQLGVRPGDRVLMALPNCPEFVAAWFALHWLGAQVVPANPLYSVNDLVHLAKLTQVRAVIALDLRVAPVLEMTRHFAPPLLIVASLQSHLPLKLRLLYRIKNLLSARIRGNERTRVLPFEDLYKPTCSILPEPQLTDVELPAVLQPTGGTTGVPKVALLSHRNLQANVAQIHVWSGLKPAEDVVLGVLPFFHVFGSTLALLCPIAGGATICLQARFDPKSVWKVIEKCRPTIAPMVPFMFQSLNELMRERNCNLQGIRMCLSGASGLDGDLRKEFEERTGSIISEGYGLSEASPVTHSNPPDSSARSGSIGLPLPDTYAKIMDVQTGERELAPGEVGELVVRGPQVMSGYLNNPEETADMLRDGWLFTGDLARMDEDGYFTLVDRKKDMIKSGGLNVFPSEVERVLATHPSVKECAVVGAPDRLFGERVVGYVVAQHGSHLMAEQLRAHCRCQLASYKVPRNIEFCEKLPTTFLGKLRRVDLRARAAANGHPINGMPINGNGTPVNGSHKNNSTEITANRVEKEICPKP